MIHSNIPPKNYGNCSSKTKRMISYQRKIIHVVLHCNFFLWMSHQHGENILHRQTYKSVKVIKPICVCVSTKVPMYNPLGDLSVWPTGGDGAGGRADGGKWQYDLCCLQTSVWLDQWEHWRCLSATSCRRQQGEAHMHAHTHITLMVFSFAFMWCSLKLSRTETFNWPS